MKVLKKAIGINLWSFMRRWAILYLLFAKLTSNWLISITPYMAGSACLFRIYSSFHFRTRTELSQYSVKKLETKCIKYSKLLSLYLDTYMWDLTTQEQTERDINFDFWLFIHFECLKHPITLSLGQCMGLKLYKPAVEWKMESHNTLFYLKPSCGRSWRGVSNLTRSV